MGMEGELKGPCMPTMMRRPVLWAVLLCVAFAHSTNPTVVCVTGASGFLASELIAQLLANGNYHVKATVRSTRDPNRHAYLHAHCFPHRCDALEISEADLLHEGSFDECVRGAKILFHTASPFATVGISDAQQQLIEPAVRGTKNVLRSALAANVTRVVITSSMAAVFGKPTDKAEEECFNEEDWNESSSITGDTLDKYRLSKVLAEKAAWEMVAATKGRVQMATVNPSFIIGPPRTPRTDGESVRNMKQLLEGEMPHRGDTPMVDVRDCAKAHILAGTLPTAAGKRFLTSTPNAVQRASVVQWVRRAYPALSRGILDLGPPKPGPHRVIFCSQTRHILEQAGLKFHAVDESIRDMAAAMLKLGSAVPKQTRQEV